MVDAFGNPADADVTLDLGGRPWDDATLDGPTSLQAVNGVATFDSLTLNLPGSGYTLLVSVSGPTRTLPTFESHAFAVALHFHAVAAGLLHTCGATTGGLYCWGYPLDSVPRPFSGAYFFDSLTAGDYHTCGLKSDGTVWCFGENTLGQTGTGSFSTTVSSPTQVSGGPTYTQVVAGHSHTCALAATGNAYCWGLNSSGQLGDSTTTNRAVPTLVAGGHQFLSLAAGGAHTCGQAADSTLYCWGANGQGQLGNGSVTPDSAPHQVAGPLVVHLVAASDLSTCADSANFSSVYCWGDDTYGEIGGLGSSSTPKKVPLGWTPEIAGSLGGYFCYTDTTANSCVGNNGNGQLGNGGGFGSVTGGIVFDHVRGGGPHTCGLSLTHGLYCWGYNADGELGNGNTIRSFVPVRVLQ